MKASLIILSCLAITAGSPALAGASETALTQETKSTTRYSPIAGIDASPGEKIKHYDPSALRRLDFRIQGKSCAICLLGIQKRIKALDGAVRVAIMLKKPYGASVIYDSKQLTEQKLILTAKANEPLIKLVDVKDEAIDKVPLILVPPHANVPEPPSASSNLLSTH
jgi:hypothetical protein